MRHAKPVPLAPLPPPPRPPRGSRHARLFELIRQERLAEQRCRARRAAAPPDPDEAAAFLSRARRSLAARRAVAIPPGPRVWI